MPLVYILYYGVTWGDVTPYKYLLYGEMNEETVIAL